MKFSELSPAERYTATSHSMFASPEAGLKTLHPLNHLDFEDGGILEEPLTNPYASNVLLALEAFSLTIAEELKGAGQVYLFQENSLFFILKTAGLSFEPSSVPVLSTLGLIYKFNAARKFGYPMRGHTQLRINSWGSFVIEYSTYEQMGTLTICVARSVPRRCGVIKRPTKGWLTYASLENVHFFSKYKFRQPKLVNSSPLPTGVFHVVKKGDCHVGKIFLKTTNSRSNQMLLCPTSPAPPWCNGGCSLLRHIIKQGTSYAKILNPTLDIAKHREFYGSWKVGYHASYAPALLSSRLQAGH